MTFFQGHPYVFQQDNAKQSAHIKGTAAENGCSTNQFPIECVVNFETKICDDPICFYGIPVLLEWLMLMIGSGSSRSSINACQIQHATNRARGTCQSAQRSLTVNITEFYLCSQTPIFQAVMSEMSAQVKNSDLFFCWEWTLINCRC